MCFPQRGVAATESRSISRKDATAAKVGDYGKESFVRILIFTL
jgi:hypothetical protein